MPLAIPIIAASVIGAGGSIASSLINKRASNNASKANNAGSLLPPGLDQNALLGLINKQTGIADWFNTEGKQTLGQGKDVLTGPLDYLTPILKGDRTAIMEGMAPEIAAINAQFKAPLKDASITGRGSSLVPDLEAGRQSAISNAIFQARPAASDKLTAIAQGLMGLGTQQVGLGASTLQSAANETLDYNQLIRGIQAQTRGDKANAMGALGDALGPLLKDILGGVIGGSGSGGSKGGTTGGGGGTEGKSDLTFGSPEGLAALISSMQGAPEIKGGWLPQTGGK